MADHDYKHGGWREKCVIFKKCPTCKGEGHPCDKCVHGLVPVDPKAVYFVLRLDEDPHARAGAVAYAQSIQSENLQLAIDIRRKLAETHKPEFER